MKIAVLLSGGVDSSVALALLARQGHEVHAYYIKIWLEDELSFLGTCPWQEDLAYAQAVCAQLNVPLHIVSLQREYHDEVVAYTIAQIKAGRTPNPDMMCNQRIKFGMFLNHIDASYEYVASGHYAHVEHTPTGSHLLQSPDAIKDQTYFLSQLSPAQLARTLFPLGIYTKAEVRAFAHEWDLPTKDRKDSQGICFLGKLKFTDFIKQYLGTRTGDIVEWETKNTLGTHEGYWFYTVGQRQGLRLASGPWYVVAKDCARNMVYVSRQYYSDDKSRNMLSMSACNWLANPPADGSVVQVKLRHGALFHTARVTYQTSDILHLTLQEHDQGIAAGQFAVLYDAGICLGGGVIV